MAGTARGGGTHAGILAKRSCGTRRRQLGCGVLGKESSLRSRAFIPNLLLCLLLRLGLF